MVVWRALEKHALDAIRIDVMQSSGESVHERDAEACCRTGGPSYAQRRIKRALLQADRCDVGRRDSHGSLTELGDS